MELTRHSGRAWSKLWTHQDEGKSGVTSTLAMADARKTLTVLNPFGRIDQHIMDDSDVAGPILFFLIFGTSLLVRR